MDISRFFYCVDFNGQPITDEMWQLFFRAAQRLLDEEKDSIKIKGDGLGGQVSTAFKAVHIGGYSGFEFHAVYESNKGKTKLTFLSRRYPNLVGDEAVELLLI